MNGGNFFVITFTDSLLDSIMKSCDIGKDGAVEEGGIRFDSRAAQVIVWL